MLIQHRSCYCVRLVSWRGGTFREACLHAKSDQQDPTWYVNSPEQCSVDISCSIRLAISSQDRQSLSSSLLSFSGDGDMMFLIPIPMPGFTNAQTGRRNNVVMIIQVRCTTGWQIASATQRVVGRTHVPQLLDINMYRHFNTWMWPQHF